MYPIAIYESLVSDSRLYDDFGIGSDRIVELQSHDTRPFDTGYWIVIDIKDQIINTTVNRGPRTVYAWVHTPDKDERDYTIINRILKVIDEVFSAVELWVGSDQVRITEMKRISVSENLRDEGWSTIARHADYRVLYDDSMA